MPGADPDPGHRANPLSATSRQSPAARRARQDAIVIAGCGVIEVVAWSVAWMLDWQLGALAGAIAVSSGVALAAVLLLARKKQG